MLHVIRRLCLCALVAVALLPAPGHAQTYSLPTLSGSGEAAATSDRAVAAWQIYRDYVDELAAAEYWAGVAAQARGDVEQVTEAVPGISGGGGAAVGANEDITDWRAAQEQERQHRAVVAMLLQEWEAEGLRFTIGDLATAGEMVSVRVGDPGGKDGPETVQMSRIEFLLHSRHDLLETPPAPPQEPAEDAEIAPPEPGPVFELAVLRQIATEQMIGWMEVQTPQQAACAVAVFEAAAGPDRAARVLGVLAFVTDQPNPLPFATNQELVQAAADALYIPVEEAAEYWGVIRDARGRVANCL